MISTVTNERVNIRPGVTVLAVLRHLNYRPWFALAEFVDNSLQSFLAHKDDLRSECGQSRLSVSITLDPSDDGRLTIRDNAAGIFASEYPRAFRPAEVPPDTSGLNEFGMGMKSAACWLAKRWTVRTSALGDDVERTIAFDISKIVNGQIEELDVHTALVDPRHHYTEIVLTGLHQRLYGRTIGKVKEHLTGIYRVFLRDGSLELRFDGETLNFTEPEVLCAPFYKTPSAPAVTWRKDLAFDFGLGLRAHGFAALRRIGSTTGAGFALFRKNRLIEGSADEGYRPEPVFGKSNSYAYQRLFGELHLDGFEVSHTKDGFKWQENEEVFLSLLRDMLDDQALPLLSQAEGFRSRPKPSDLQAGAETATKHTAATIEREAPPVLEGLVDSTLEQDLPSEFPGAHVASKRNISIRFADMDWEIVLELSDDPAVGDWLDISDDVLTDTLPLDITRRRVGVRLGLAHPFMERFGGTTTDSIEPLLRVACALALAESAAREAGVKKVGVVRRNVNELLRHALSKP